MMTGKQIVRTDINIKTTIRSTTTKIAFNSSWDQQLKNERSWVSSWTALPQLKTAMSYSKVQTSLCRMRVNKLSKNPPNKFPTLNNFMSSRTRWKKLCHTGSTYACCKPSRMVNHPPLRMTLICQSKKYWPSLSTSWRTRWMRSYKNTYKMSLRTLKRILTSLKMIHLWKLSRWSSLSVSKYAWTSYKRWKRAR